MWCVCYLKPGGLLPHTIPHGVLLTADIWLFQTFRSHAVSSFGLRATVPRGTDVLTIGMRAARSDRGCAGPKSAMSSRHHGEARCGDDTGRTMPASRHVAQQRCGHQRQLGATTPALGALPCLAMAADRERSRGPHRLKSQPCYYPMGETARRLSYLTPCQTAMTIALFRSCHGPSAALFTVQRI